VNTNFQVFWSFWSNSAILVHRRRRRKGKRREAQAESTCLPPHPAWKKTFFLF